jgi:hypothetical protein
MEIITRYNRRKEDRVSMILAENKIGQQLLSYIQISEEEINMSEEYKPITGSLHL